MQLSSELKQTQVLSQYMLQSMEILQMNSLELEKYIENLSLENPLIELSEENHQCLGSPLDLNRKLEWLESTDYQNKVYYRQEYEQNFLDSSWNPSLSEDEQLSNYLISQLDTTNFSPKELRIIEYIILLLDSNGYLTDATSDIGNYLDISEDTVCHFLSIIQTLEPAGCGARSLQECLLLQLYRNPNYSQVTESIIKNHLSDIAKNHLSVIAKKLQIPLPEVVKSCSEIKTFNPKPGSSFCDRSYLKYILPDMIIVKLDNYFEILVNESQFPNFSISSQYKNILDNDSTEEVQKYLKQKLSQVNWLQNCISQRTATLSSVVNVIVEEQILFFQYGPLYKKPLHLVDIAKKLNVHESTVSRALRGKYLQCTWGVFPLNFFLTASICSTNLEASTITPEKVKHIIGELVAAENQTNPYSDNIITQLLANQGIRISRRTVAKYRTEAGIPDKSGRKIWQ